MNHPRQWPNHLTQQQISDILYKEYFEQFHKKYLAAVNHFVVISGESDDKKITGILKSLYWHKTDAIDAYIINLDSGLEHVVTVLVNKQGTLYTKPLEEFAIPDNGEIELLLTCANENVRTYAKQLSELYPNIRDTAIPYAYVSQQQVEDLNDDYFGSPDVIEPELLPQPLADTSEQLVDPKAETTTIIEVPAKKKRGRPKKVV